VTIEAKQALETPQILVEWTFDDIVADIEYIRIRRSDYRYPETVSEGDAVLDEAADMADLRASFADISVDADKVYYYSVFFDLYGQFAVPQELSQDVERLGELFSVYRHHDYLPLTQIALGTGGIDTYTGYLSTPVKPRSLTFTTVVGLSATVVTDNGAGALVGDIGIGNNMINYDTGYYDVTFVGNVDPGSPVYVDYGYGDDKYWIFAKNNSGVPVLWSYNTTKELCEEEIDLSAIISERPVAILNFDLTSSTRTFELLTSSKYVAVTIDSDATEVLTGDVTQEWDLSTILSPGFNVVGGCKEFSPGPSEVGIRILDSTNEELLLVSSSGTLLSTTDLSGLDLSGSYYGCSYDLENLYYLIGSGKMVYAFDTAETAPTNPDIQGLIPVRRSLTSDFSREGDRLVVVDDSVGVIDKYAYENLSDIAQIEEAAYPNYDVAGLWHLDDEADSGTVVDSSGNGNDGSLGGTPTQGITGKFSLGTQLNSVGDSIDLSGAASLFDSNKGFVSFWWKSPYSGYMPPSGDRFLATISVDASNRLDIELLANGDVSAALIKGGTSNAAVATGGYVYLSSDLFSHIHVQWDVSNIYLYINGTLRASAAIAGVFAGTASSFLVGGASSDSALGFYDDVVLGTEVKASFFPRYTLTTVGNRAHALSGRDPDAVEFNFRDKLKYYFGDFILENDTGKLQLSPDKALSDHEVILRQDRDELYLGELGRLSRLFGLFLDRIVDYRRFFMNHLIASEVEDEFIDLLGELIYAKDFDEDWNVEQRRRFLEVTWYCFQRGGTVDAFARMVRFLGFRLYAPDGDLPVVVARRKFDSVVNPNRPDTPFDTDTFDSFGSSHYLAKLFFRFYLFNYESHVGTTSVPATRQLTDAGAQFTETAEEGSLVYVYDRSDPGDNGQYIVSSVVSDTVLEVDTDWKEGSNTNLSFKLYWRVPNPDPYTDEILTRLDRIKARWQSLVKDPDLV